MACCAKKDDQGSKTANIEDRKFVPKYSAKALAEKFYSKYENIDSTVTVSSEIASQIEEHIKYDRRTRYFAPVTENQVYGWYGHLANRTTWDEDDSGITFFPRKVDEQIAVLTTINVGLRRLGMK